MPGILVVEDDDAFCVCTNCPCPSGTNSYTAKYNDSERKAK